MEHMSNQEQAALVGGQQESLTARRCPTSPAENGEGERHRTFLFCPVCGHEFLPEEIGKKPHCRRCGYLESCCNPE